jgi:hypothetical protein
VSQNVAGPDELQEENVSEKAAIVTSSRAIIILIIVVLYEAKIAIEIY